MLDFFPKQKEKYNENIRTNEGVLETVLVEDIFMPALLAILKRNEDVKLLRDIFEYFEEVANCQDKRLKDIFSVTVLEILGNDKETLEMAKEYMGPKTVALQLEADRALGRMV